MYNLLNGNKLTEIIKEMFRDDYQLLAIINIIP